MSTTKRKNKNKAKNKKIVLDVPNNLHKRYKIYCVENNLTMSQCLLKTLVKTVGNK